MSDKVRLIDAEKLGKAIELLCKDERTNMTAITYFALRELLDTMPTVEAEPVKHGMWEQISQNKFTGAKTLRCTYCKNYFVVRDDTLNAGRGDANFCPLCGCKQDLDGDIE